MEGKIGMVLARAQRSEPRLCLFYLKCTEGWSPLSRVRDCSRMAETTGSVHESPFRRTKPRNRHISGF